MAVVETMPAAAATAVEDRSVDGLAGIREALASPESLATDRLEHQIMVQAGQLSAAMCRWLLLVAEYDRREAYGGWECRSMAHWLEWKCGLAAATAREHVRVARAIAALPLIRAAFGRAEVSYSKVRALTRVATPDTEADLLELAVEMTGSQLDRVMRSLEKAAQTITEADLHKNYARRDLIRYEDNDGLPCWLLRPSPEEDLMLQKAVEYARDRDWADARAEARQLAGANGEARPAKVEGKRGSKLPRIDALFRILEWGMTRAAEYDDDELPSERYQVVLHLNGSPRVGDDGLVHLEGGVKLHPKTAQRLGCNATVTLVDGDGNELNKGRRARLFTRRQRRALAKRRNTCAFPHCDIPARWCQAHHVVDWIKGGATDLENGLFLCARHHHAVHEGGWRLFVDPNGMIIAVGPDGRRVTRSALTQPPAPGFLMLDWHTKLGLHVTPNLEPPYERADMRYVIDVLISNFELEYRKKQAAERAAREQAEEPVDASSTAEAAASYSSPQASGQRPLLN